MAMTCSDDGSIRCWDLDRGAETAADPANLPQPISAAVWAEMDGRKVVMVADSQGGISCFNSEGQRCLMTVGNHSSRHCAPPPPHPPALS